MFTKYLLPLIVILYSTATYAQTYNISGRIIDVTDGTSLAGVEAILISQSDSTIRFGTTTDTSGRFYLSGILSGQYHFRSLYLGYKAFEQNVTVLNQDIFLGTLQLKSGGNRLKTVTVKGKQIRAQQIGDTTQFNADAYKTNPDATAEDLVTKMPGVTSDNNGVKVNGEDVKQVYVDGKPFFGDDPTLALRNLPAEVIDKIQVFDKLSDQSQFTGFDDGNSQKTLNIVTKRNKRNGEFGKVYAGYGTDDRYMVGGNLNVFDGDRRISILELSNNVNQQNFSMQDILGVMGNGGGMNRGGMGRAGASRGSFGGSGGFNSGANNFLVGQQGGITTTHSVGLNYSDNWGKKIKITGSYFFNYTDNTNNTDLARDYFTTGDSSLVYHEHDQSENKNINHRFNFRFEYDIDSYNALIITPRLNMQLTDATSGQVGIDSLGDITASKTNNNTANNNAGYSFSNDILFQHKFRKRGRTISFDLGTSLNEKSGDGTYYSSTQYAFRDTLFDQHYTLNNNGYTLSGNLSYTEPLSSKSQLMFTYAPSYTKNKADKETNDKDSLTDQYTVFDPTLSNKYDNTYTTQRGGISYRMNNGKLRMMAGTNFQYADLQGDQTFPSPLPIERNFVNVLPIAMLNYRFNDGTNLRLMYRTNTTPPAISQLQNVLDISNPILLKTGNPDLLQDYEHTLIARYGLTKPSKAHNFFVFLYFNYINNYISNATVLPLTDTNVSIAGNAYHVAKGSQLTYPVNLNGYWNTKSFVTYSLPMDFMKSNLNLNGGFTFARQPALVNNILNVSNNYIPSAGIVISSNVSEDLDFTLSYSGSYNVVKNTFQSQSDQNYYNHTASLKINWIVWKSLVFNTNITNTYFSGLANSGDESFFLWNAYVAYKFLKNHALEARLSVFDILNQNKSISRTVTETYLEDSRTQVLQQYFMFTLTYTLRHFKGMAMPGNSDMLEKYRMMMPPGSYMPRHG